MKKMRLVLVFFTVLSCLFGARVSATEFIESIGGSFADSAIAIVQTADGGFVVAGHTDSFGANGSRDHWVVKLDGSGAVQFQKTYGGMSSDQATSMVQTAEGGFALAGPTFSFGTEFLNIWLLRLDGSGAVQFEKTYGGDSEDQAFSMIQTVDGGFAVTGLTVSFGAGLHDVLVLKLDASGEVEFQRTYGGSRSDSASSIIQTADGGFAVAGVTESLSIFDRDIWVLKLDASGAVEFEKIYGGSDTDAAFSIIQTADAGFAVAGRTWSFGAGGNDLWILKLDASGEVEFEKAYGGSGHDEAFSIVQTTDGGFAVVGATGSFGAGGNDLWILKLDASGAVEFEKAYGGSGNDFGRSVIQTADGGFAVTGGTDSFATDFFDSDVWVLKLDSNGDVPACPFRADSEATVTTTSANIGSLGISGVPSFALIESTSALVSDTSAPMDVQCESFDSDGDGIPDDIDACPSEDASGFDADADGCIDNFNGIVDIVDNLAPALLANQMKTPLIAKINAAAQLATNDRLCAAAHVLEALSFQIGAQRGKKISAEVADLLIAYANNVIAQLLSQLSAGESCP